MDYFDGSIQKAFDEVSGDMAKEDKDTVMYMLGRIMGNEDFSDETIEQIVAQVKDADEQELYRDKLLEVRERVAGGPAEP